MAKIYTLESGVKTREKNNYFLSFFLLRTRVYKTHNNLFVRSTLKRGREDYIEECTRTRRRRRRRRRLLLRSFPGRKKGRIGTNSIVKRKKRDTPFIIHSSIQTTEDNLLLLCRRRRRELAPRPPTRPARLVVVVVLPDHHHPRRRPRPPRRRRGRREKKRRRTKRSITCTNSGRTTLETQTRTSEQRKGKLTIYSLGIEGMANLNSGRIQTLPTAICAFDTKKFDSSTT